MKAIIVDDEERARDVLSNLIHRFCVGVNVVASCENLLDAVEAINLHNPDMVFLDIEMPQYAGYEIVRFFEHTNFGIIFTTAYEQYAIKAFELAAIDYLLKPIDIERLKQAVSRVQLHKYKEDKIAQLSILNNVFEDQNFQKIVITDKGQQKIITISTIIAIEAKESYCIIYTTESKYLVSKNLKHFETLLERISFFFRVHKSWLINISKVQTYSKSHLSIILSNGLITKLSKYKKAEFEACFKVK